MLSLSLPSFITLYSLSLSFIIYHSLIYTHSHTHTLTLFFSSLSSYQSLAYSLSLSLYPSVTLCHSLTHSLLSSTFLSFITLHSRSHGRFILPLLSPSHVTLPHSLAVTPTPSVASRTLTLAWGGRVPGWSLCGGRQCLGLPHSLTAG